jgi:hypothetical protein
MAFLFALHTSWLEPLGSHKNERIAKLEAEVEALFNLTIRAYEKFIFLRPTLTNQELHDRIGKEANTMGFRQLRNWLY